MYRFVNSTKIDCGSGGGDGKPNADIYTNAKIGTISQSVQHAGCFQSAIQ